MKVLTDISFPEVNRLYHRHMPATLSSPPYFLAHLLNVKATCSSRRVSTQQTAIDDVNASIIRQHVGQLFNRLGPSRRAAEAFQEFALTTPGDCRSGSSRLVPIYGRSAILPKAAKFKEWLLSTSANQMLSRLIFGKSSHPTRIDKLPSKVVRWFELMALAC